MGLFDRLRWAISAGKTGNASPRASGQFFEGLTDPALLDYIRGGAKTNSGAYVTSLTALSNMAVLRCVSLISQSIAMLPLNLYRRGDKREKATDHAVHEVLHSAPNNWQTPMEFKSTMQLWALQHGTAYARIIRSMGRVVRLVPIQPGHISVRQNDDWSLTFNYTRPDGGTISLAPEDVFVLRDLSMDGVTGMSRVSLAKEAIGLAMQAEQAAAQLFKNGMMVGGVLKHPKTLSEAALTRLRKSLEDRYTGAENAQKWPLLEEGLDLSSIAQSASDSQHIENRTHQIEEIARAFGVPRPLLMMDDTSWGSGIEQLAIFFVQYGLQPWFTAWEEAISRSLLTPPERKLYYPKFNERALMRGTLKDQADFFAKALGSGGHRPWMAVNEVRDLSELPRSDEKIADSLESVLLQRSTANEPA